MGEYPGGDVARLGLGSTLDVDHYPSAYLARQEGVTLRDGLGEGDFLGDEVEALDVEILSQSGPGLLAQGERGHDAVYTTKRHAT